MIRVALVATVMAITLCTASTPADAQVRVVDGRVMIHVVDASLRDVFERLVRLDVIDAFGVDHLGGTISLDLETESVTGVIDALLADYNFVVAGPSPEANGGTAHYVVRIHSRRGTAAIHETGPIVVSALETALLTDAEAPSEADEPPTDVAGQIDSSEELAADFADRQRDGELSPNTPFDELLERIDDDNPLVRAWILDLLTARDPQNALPHLTKALSDDNARVANQAVGVMASRTDLESLVHLGELVQGEGDTIVRIRALASLARRADPRSAPYIEAVTQDANHIIRQSAAQVLAAFKRRLGAAKRPSR